MNFLRCGIAGLSCLLPVVLAGCSTTMGSRFGGTPQSKSIAVVGDRPVSVASGEPGGQKVVEADPEPRIDPKARISGRVVDDQGEPVSGVTVRLADGGAKGGKDIRGTTDKSGAFTLNGLRPGVSYSLIAEAEDDQGPLTGRATAKTSTTGLEISLLSEEAASKAARRKTARPISKARPISSREESAEEPAEDGRALINREDVSSSSDPSDTLDPGPRTELDRPRLSPPQAASGWQNNASVRKIRPRADDVDSDAVATSADEIPRRSRVIPASSSVGEDEEGENPLPPAIEPGQADEPAPRKPTSAKIKRTSKPAVKPPVARPETGEMSLTPDTTAVDKPEPLRNTAIAAAELPALAAPSGDESGLLPEPAMMARAEPSVAPVPSNGSAPTAMPPVAEPSDSSALAAGPPGLPPANPGPSQNAAPTIPATQPVFASQEPAQPSTPPKPAAPAEYNPFLLVGAATPADATATQGPASKIVETTAAESEVPATAPPVAPGPKTRWGDLAMATPRDPAPKLKVEPTKATLASTFVKRFRPSPVEKVEKVDPGIASCAYDAKLLRVKDFRLPGLDGKPVRFQELDADYVLLDFWGTWCSPCLESIPHLIELQKRYGPSRLKVIGIACEEVPIEQRKARVEEFARRFGINYTVLMSSMDGKPCPVQQALSIQAMPTMILLDRKGQVLWRSTGSTPANESRLDRVLASQMSWSDTVRR